jgi:hypothetical protein
MNQAVEDTVGDGGVADLLVPARDRQLRSEDGGASLVAILADLPNFATLAFIQRSHGPVIDNQNIDASQSCQEVAQAAVGSRCSFGIAFPSPSSPYQPCLGTLATEVV